MSDLEELRAEFVELLEDYSGNPQVLQAAVLHIGLGRLSLAIQEHGESVGTSTDALKSIENTINNLAFIMERAKYR